MWTRPDAAGVGASAIGAGTGSQAPAGQPAPSLPLPPRAATGTAPALPAPASAGAGMGSEQAGSPPGRTAIRVAVLVALGIALSRLVDAEGGGAAAVWPWIAVAAICTLAAAWITWSERVRRVIEDRLSRWSPVLINRLPPVLLGIAVVMVAAAWAGCRMDRVPRNDIVRTVDPQGSPRVYRLEGRIRTPPAVREYTEGPLANPWASRPRTYFQIAVEAAVGGPGVAAVVDGFPAPAPSPAPSIAAPDRTPLAGRVLVRISDEERRLRVGDRVRVTGVLSPFPRAANPGEPDRAEIARRQGLAGILAVANRDGVERLESGRWTQWWSAFGRWRARLHEQAAGWLVRSFPDSQDERRHALVEAMLLGDRGPALDSLDRSFRRVGLSHVLAISGLHLVVLTFTIVAVVRALGLGTAIGGGGTGGGVRATELLLVVVIVGVYLMIVPARAPVWRAGLTAVVFAVAGLGGRRARSASLLSMAATALLLRDPSELFEPGFQLSFGIVAAFIALSGPVDLRLRGLAFDLGMVIPVASRELADRLPVQPGSAEDAALLAAEEPRSVADFLVLSVWSSLVISFVAWAVSLPTIVYHFGMVCPLAVLASMVAMPVVVALLATGYIKAVFTVLFPSVSVVLGPILVLWADTLIGIVDRMEELPLAAVSVQSPGLLWSVGMTVTVVWWLKVRLRERPRLRTLRRGLLGLGAGWLFLPQILTVANLNPEVGRVTMLSVGAGACTIVEAGGEAFLVDAGSATVTVVGERLIVPALQKRGINRLDSIIISHADSDHYNGVLGVIDAVGVRRVILTTATMAQVHGQPELVPVLATLVEELKARDVEVEVVAAGEVRRIGAARLTWLHPQADDAYVHDNEASAALRVDLAEARFLFTGDLIDTGLELMLDRVPAAALRADVLEMPHHGARPDENTRRLIETVQPVVLLQSATGTRFEEGVAFVRDTSFAGLPAGAPLHFATPESGAVTLIVGRDGWITAVPFRAPSTAVRVQTAAASSTNS